MREFAAGASAARNKVKKYLEDMGINFQTSNPPTDEEFFDGIVEFIEDLSNMNLIYDDLPFKEIEFSDTTNYYRFRIPSKIPERLRSGNIKSYELFKKRYHTGYNHYTYKLIYDKGQFSVTRGNRPKDNYQVKIV